MKLSDAKLHEIYRVKKIDCSLSIQKRLRSLGMTENTAIEILHKKRNGTCVINLRGTRFALGNTMAERIEVVL